MGNPIFRVSFLKVFNKLDGCITDPFLVHTTKLLSYTCNQVTVYPFQPFP